MWLNMHTVMAAPLLRLPVKTRRQSISLLGLLFFSLSNKECMLSRLHHICGLTDGTKEPHPDQLEDCAILHDPCLRVGGINWTITSLGRQCFLHSEEGKGQASFIEKSGLRQQYCYVFSKLISFSSWLHSRNTFLSLL